MTASLSEKSLSPPVVPISREVRQSSAVHDAYNKALDEHGPVVIVPRHGRTEYIIDHRHAYDVLTDSKNFTFDKAAFELLHVDFMAWFKEGNFIQDMDSLVQGGVQPRLAAIVDQVVPVFDAYFDKMAVELSPSNAGDEKAAWLEVPDVFPRIQQAVAHAMVVIILGHGYSSPAMARDFAAITVAIANLTGMHENTHGWEWAPFLWSVMTTLGAVFFTIVPRFFLGIVPSLWRSRRRHLANGLAASHTGYVPLFDYLLAKYYKDQTGLAALRSFTWCATLCLGIIFGSIHQTAVTAFWVVLKMAQKQEKYLPPIREEWEATLSSEGQDGATLSVKTLSQLTLLDSFIREVMRTKGDTWAPIRYTTRPVRVGPYMLPKGAFCMVFVPRANQHPDNYGTTGAVFDGFQWQKKQRPAAQGTKDFLNFGLGRWACPGRHLAVHEMKILVYMFFSRFEVSLKDNHYRITNAINTTSVPPEAVLLMRKKREKSSM